MGVDILSNVPKDKIFWLADGRSVSGINELYSVLKHLPNELFSQHVNDSKNDFYNWVRDVHQDKKLADDLLECNTKEAMLFCLKFKIEQAESLSILNEIPRENVLEKVKNVTAKKLLVTMLDPAIFQKKVTKPVTKTKNNKNISVNETNEKLNKAQIKKIKAETKDQIMQRLKEVYKFD
ncbi:hypothetical protein J4230_01215 [Candidatus Woesearchaeota archaeon]|nr:hypothetical protein [Candidatus Woesearchaeota archaeon]